MPTLNDVAKKAGVSATTVSRVLNDRPSSVPISEETRQKVRQAAEALRYFPNFFARSLRTKTSGIIGVVVTDITDSYFGQILSGMEQVLNAESNSFLLSSIENSTEDSGRYLERLARIGVDGFLIAGTMSAEVDEEIRNLVERGVPVVLIGHKCNVEAPTVTVDNLLGGKIATDHLIAQGYRSVVHITSDQARADVRDRLDGYTASMKEHDLEKYIRVETGGNSIESGHAVARRVLPELELPAAFFAFNDIVAVGVIEAIDSRGSLRIPEDVAVAGFDDIPIAEHYRPSLTSIRQPRSEMGRMGAELLLKLIKGQQVDQRDVVFSPELYIRASTGGARRTTTR